MEQPTARSSVALIKEEFGRELRRLRKAANLTQEALARRVGYHRVSITQVEKGRQDFSRQFVTQVEAALDARGRLLAIYERLDTGRCEAQLQASLPVGPLGQHAHGAEEHYDEASAALLPVEAGQRLGQIEIVGGQLRTDSLVLQAPTLAADVCFVPVSASDGTVVLIAMDRRTLLSGVVVAAFAPHEATANNATENTAYLLTAHKRKRYFAPVEDLTAFTRSYRRLDRHLPAWRLIDAASAHYRFLDGLYIGGAGDVAGMAAAVSEAAGFAAWLSMDMGQLAQAQRYYQGAIKAAREASNSPLAAYMLGSLSWLSAQLGQGTKALELVRSAKGKVGSTAAGNPTISAWLAVHEALAYATLRKEDRALEFLERGAEAVQRAERDAVVWPWLSPFGQAKLAGFSGACFVRLRRASDARSALSSALASSADGSRERAEILVDLAQAFTLKPQQDIDRACSLLGDAAAISADRGSGRLWQRVHNIRTGLNRYGTSHSVQRLDERLRSFSQ